jgi:hypothetical protein
MSSGILKDDGMESQGAVEQILGRIHYKDRTGEQNLWRRCLLHGQIDIYN